MNLQSLKSAAEDARAEAQKTALAFEKNPDDKTLDARSVAERRLAVAQQRVANAEKIATEQRREELIAKRELLVARASHAGLIAAIEPNITEVASAVAQLDLAVKKIADKLADQHAAFFEYCDVANALEQGTSDAKRFDQFALRSTVIERLRLRVRIETPDLAEWIKLG